MTFAMFLSIATLIVFAAFCAAKAGITVVSKSLELGEAVSKRMQEESWARLGVTTNENMDHQV